MIAGVAIATATCVLAAAAAAAGQPFPATSAGHPAGGPAAGSLSAALDAAGSANRTGTIAVPTPTGDATPTVNPASPTAEPTGTAVTGRFYVDFDAQLDLDGDPDTSARDDIIDHEGVTFRYSIGDGGVIERSSSSLTGDDLPFVEGRFTQESVTLSVTQLLPPDSSWSSSTVVSGLWASRGRTLSRSRSRRTERRSALTSRSTPTCAATS
jgi:hypothetical protein